MVPVQRWGSVVVSSLLQDVLRLWKNGDEDRARELGVRWLARISPEALAKHMQSASDHPGSDSIDATRSSFVFCALPSV